MALKNSVAYLVFFIVLKTRIMNIKLLILLSLFFSFAANAEQKDSFASSKPSAFEVATATNKADKADCYGTDEVGVDFSGNIYFCLSGKWAVLSASAPAGSLCGFYTTASRYTMSIPCKGVNIASGCPEGYSKVHFPGMNDWTEKRWGQNSYHCVKQ